MMTQGERELEEAQNHNPAEQLGEVMAEEDTELKTVDLTGTQEDSEQEVSPGQHIANAIDKDILSSIQAKADAEGVSVPRGDAITEEALTRLDNEITAENEEPPVPEFKRVPLRGGKYDPPEPITHLRNLDTGHIFPVNDDIIKQYHLKPCDKNGKLLEDTRDNFR